MSLLTPIDLLTVPDVQQDIIRCLVRTPRLTAGEIAGRLRRPLAEIEGVLSDMESARRLTRERQGSKDIFDVALQQTRRPASGLLDSLFG